MRSKSALHWVLAGCVVALGCGPSSTPGEGDLDGGGKPTIDDAGNIIRRNIDAPEEEDYVDAGPPQPNWDAFVKDPPPMYCGPDGGAVLITPPTGSVDCPDDKNNEGCPCLVPGKKAACWPGYRVDRDRGICQDGETECVPYDDVTAYWGPCMGYTLPKDPPETRGDRCDCFEAGTWTIENLSPCLVSYDGRTTYFAFSSHVTGYDPVEGTAIAECTQVTSGPPPKKPAESFSKNRINVDCQGQFKLCFKLRAGDQAAPKETDCVVVEICTEAWIPELLGPDEFVVLPDLPGWTTNNSACSTKFTKSGGYAEMTVQGMSIECDPVDDGNGKPFVFSRIGYCPLICNEQPSLPECANCSNGTSGSF